MTQPQLAPREAYHNRPAVSDAFPPRKMGTLRALAFTARMLVRSVSQTLTFYADWSYYQVVVNGLYPFRIACIRIDSGYMTDPEFAANWAALRKRKRVAIVFVYCVYVEGHAGEALARIKTALGGHCPVKVIFRIDVESGEQFAGPGNHSAGVTAFAEELAKLRATAFVHDTHPVTRGRRGVDIYANHYDWVDCLPDVPAWLRKYPSVAKYSDTPPDDPWDSWQYAGGDPRWGSPAGYPRSCAPFGSVIDMNVIRKPVKQIALERGVHIVTPPPPPTPAPRPHTPTARLYEVKNGDTIVALAARFHVPWPTLVHMNRRRHPRLVRNPDYLKVGWRIWVPTA